ncbi:hypothetical protein GCM10010435_44270 [Winogradskya consettensis]|uniref:Portal protein n=1 Tax=Winogradskya consettensis TaxID=113560 RepID=A0A919T0Q3_9ACTN|nr:phage portal protein [Actinoplanes consettensis]GIM82666.1 hypothetical protein Aco04nite_82660 [Actinoplanes consettensis]
MPAQPDAPLTPMWWVKRLYKQLLVQRDHFELMDAYYRGAPASVPWLPEQARREFSRLLKLTKSNYMGLVVDSMVERMIVDGFRVGDNAEADKPTWDIWQANNLDAGFDQVLLESAIGGSAFLLVAPNTDRVERPFIFTEHPTQATVEYEPGTSRRVRAAGLKLWADDWTGRTFATLYLPEKIYKFQTDKKSVIGEVAEPRWEPRPVRGEAWPAPNPLGEVPLVEIANNPRMLGGGVSEIADVVSIQDRISKTLADRLMTQDFGAFPQKWAIGFPDEDADGNKTEIDVGRNRMVTSEMAETKFGQFDAAPLDPYSAAKREDVKDIASRTRTPAQYLLGEMSNVNGETLKASESGLVSKVRQRSRTSGEGAEAGARLARRTAGLGGDDESMETIWKNPEFRTEGELVDALVKMSTLGVPQEALWERWGASQVEIRRWKTMLEEQDARDPVAALAREQAAAGGNVV